MIIDSTLKRVHISNYNVVTPDGVQHPYMNNAQICAAFSYTEIADPVRADDRYYYNTEQDTAPYIVSTLKPLAQIQSQKLADLAAYRFQRETGGTTLNGSPIATDRDSQNMLNHAVSAGVINPAQTFDWKTATPAGAVWTALTVAQVNAIAAAVAAHVQGCFSNEKAHYNAITALTDPLAVIAYDFTTGWPA